MSDAEIYRALTSRWVLDGYPYRWEVEGVVSACTNWAREVRADFHDWVLLGESSGVIAFDSRDGFYYTMKINDG